MNLPPCPVRSRRIHLRDSCATCGGSPATGQLCLRRKHVLYRSGDPAETVFAIQEGCLHELMVLPDGREQGLRLLWPGDLIGLEALNEGVYRGTVMAALPSRVCRVSIGVVRRRLLSERDLVLPFMAAVLDQVDALQRSVLRIGPMTAIERVAALVEEIARRQAVGTWVRLPLARKDIAALLDLAPATVSRAMRSLTEQGRIEWKAGWVRWLQGAQPTTPVATA